MAIPETVTRYLADGGVQFEVVEHPRTASASRSAQAAHISGDRIAKGVLVKDRDGFALAVLPASHTLALGDLQKKYQREFEIAGEKELEAVFPDCELGAVPAVGRPYKLDTIVDASLLKQPMVYFEAGDHEELIGVSTADFETLMEGAIFDSISVHTA